MQIISERSIAEVINDKEAFLESFNLGTMPMIPGTNRSLDILLADGDAWSFSAEERARVAEYVSANAKTDINEHSLAEFESLANRHECARKRHGEARDNVSEPGGASLTIRSALLFCKTSSFLGRQPMVSGSEMWR